MWIECDRNGGLLRSVIRENFAATVLQRDRLRRHFAMREPKMADTPHSEGSVATAPTAAAPAPEGAEHVAKPASLPVIPPHGSRRRTWIIGITIVGILALGYLGVPIVDRAINTVSTDDAYVNSHVTFVAPRVPGQVVMVLVDDNDRVKHGDVLVQLDRVPYQVIVDQKQAALDVANANLIVAEDEVHAMVAQGRAARFKLEHSIEDVDNQIANLRATVAALQTSKAKLTRAQEDYQRVVELQKTPGAISQQDVDLKREALNVTEAQLKQSLEQVYQIRVGLGLPAQPEKADDLTAVPTDLDQNFSSVRESLGALLQVVAPLGVIPSSYDMKPKDVIAEFYKRDPEGKGNLDRIYAKIIKEAPAIKFARAQVTAAQADLDLAKLNLSYCDVLAEIDGQVTRRDVNPGNNVVAGQSLMAVRSLTEIWVDANFKETQLANIRIGQPADLDVDMYGSHKMFKGRVEGFAMGTGSTLALLPPENATGNFVKVVQRLPVRIVLPDYDPEKVPLFVGLSVTPYVYIHAEPTGPDAGQVLRPVSQLPEKPLDPKPLESKLPK
jgi:membrane fusion protein (multidrug efflux system)